jgi:hypothetical protein
LVDCGYRLSLRDLAAHADSGPHEIADYSEELVERLMTEIINGRSVHNICTTEDWAPNEDTFYTWLRERDDFSEMYARARGARADRMAAEMLEIADDTEGDLVTVTTKGGETYMRGDSAKVSRAALRVDTRKWLMARMSPRNYGDRVAHEHGDRNGNPLRGEVIVVRSTADPGTGPKAAGHEEHEGD